MKKIAICLVLTLLLASFAPVSAAPADIIGVQAEVTSVEPGIVTVAVRALQPTAAGMVTVSYDNRSLSYRSCQKETDLANIKTSDSTVTLTYANLTAEAGVLAVFTFAYGEAVTTTVSVRANVNREADELLTSSQTLTIKLLSEADVCPSTKFTDLDTESWYHEAVDYVLREGLMCGVSDTEFRPGATANRAMFVTILGRMASVDTTRYSGASQFTDVEQGSWYAPYVNWAAESGLVNGRSSTSFCPGDDITRQEMVTILTRFARSQGIDTTVQNTDVLNTFADAASVADWAAEAMAWAVESGIIRGNGTGLDPNGLANRAQIAQVMYLYGPAE